MERHTVWYRQRLVSMAIGANPTSQIYRCLGVISPRDKAGASCLLGTITKQATGTANCNCHCLLALLPCLMTPQLDANKLELPWCKMSSSPKPTRLYTFKRIFFSLLVVGNLLGCIAFALLEAYINNNFRAVWYSASKPIDVRRWPLTDSVSWN